MDGIHDLGGRQGFGPVAAECNEPPFHEPWEGRVHGLDLTVDLGPGFRHAIERMDPVEYLTTSYYEHWLHSMEQRGIAHGVFTRDELRRWSERLAGGEPVPVRLDPAAAADARAGFRPLPDRTYTAPAPRHAPGDPVRVIRRLSPGHTRCPGYVRGAAGVVERVHAPVPLLDVYESEDGTVLPEPWYTVRFAAGDLWQLDEPEHTVLVDLWESHLEANDE
ncbi:MAG: nitrile hydratase subunit beta [Gaiellales bacterium]